MAFYGYGVIAAVGDEALDPRRNVPRRILWSVCIVTAIYPAFGFALIVAIEDVGMPAWQRPALQGKEGFGQAMIQLAQ